MLSRIAESLFWIGRYVERADDTARLLDAFIHRWLEDPWADEATASQGLLRILGMSFDDAIPMTAASVVDLVAFADADPSAVAGALSAARDNARGVREVLSSEMWECLNVTWRGIPTWRENAQRLGPHGFFRFVRERTAMLAGFADSSLSRDDGWRFLQLGRSLERADMTARMLSLRMTGSDRLSTWITLLRAAGGHEAFMRMSAGDGFDARNVIDFLLLDRLFPRSVLHALSSAQNRLLELATEESRTGTSDPALRTIGLARTSLEYADITTVTENLPAYIAQVQRSCADATAAVARRYFTLTAPTAWHHEEG